MKTCNRRTLLRPAPPDWFGGQIQSVVRPSRLWRPWWSLVAPPIGLSRAASLALIPTPSCRSSDSSFGSGGGVSVTEIASVERFSGCRPSYASRCLIHLSAHTSSWPRWRKTGQPAAPCTPELQGRGGSSRPVASRATRVASRGPRRVQTHRRQQ